MADWLVYRAIGGTEAVMYFACRCGYATANLTVFLIHYRVWHGEWKVSYPDDKPLQPDPTRINEQRALTRYHRRKVK